MKKQFLILVFLVVAVFASVTMSYGQNAVVGTAPRGISCVDDAMHPLAGKQYTYQATSNQTGNYTFWATKNVNLITTSGSGASIVSTTNMATTQLTVATGALLTAGANYAKSDPADNVAITWSDATLHGTTPSTPTLVAVNQQGTCTNNIKFWQIEPIVAFTVDITNINHATKNPLAYEAAESQCFDQVRGATFVPGTTYADGRIQYDYGIDSLYWEVVAANFSVSYTPTFQISGLGNGQTATIQWDVVKTFASPTTAVAIANGTAVTSATPVTTNVTNTSAGVSIYVRVIVKNNTYEGINATPITLAVDGQNSVGDWDILNNTVAAPTPLTCTLTTGADQADAATQTLNPRPTVTTTTVGVNPPYTNPGPFIIGNETK